MTLEELYGYMENPNLLNRDTLEELRLLVESYPYCSTFSFLFLYNLAKIKDIRYTSELKKRAIMILDRSFLYQLVNDSCLSNQWKWLDKNTEVGGFDIVDDFLDKMNEQISEGNNRYSPNDYFGNLQQYGDVEEIAVGSLDTHDDTQISVADVRDEPLGSIEENGNNDAQDDNLFTETLANIYIQQEKYDKALRIIRSISLDYPEKNIYFADQMRFLERILSLKKKEIN